jgi:hypothetical protein
MDRTNLTKLRLSPLIAGYLISALYISDFWNFVNGKIRSGDFYLPESGPISKTWATELLGPMRASEIANSPHRENGAYWVRAIYFLVANVIKHDALSEAIFLSAIVFICFLSMHYFLGYLGFSRRLQFIGSLVFGFLPSQYNFLAFGWYLVSFQLALVPLLLVLFHKSIFSAKRYMPLLGGLLGGYIIFLTSLLPAIFLLLVGLLLVELRNQSSNKLIQIKNVLLRTILFSATSIIANSSWLLPSIFSLFNGNRRFNTIEANSVSLGTSINVRPMTPINQWGTGFNSSFEIAMSQNPLRTASMWAIPVLIVIGLFGSWSYKISRSFFTLSLSLLFLMAASNQADVIKLLADLGLGRDSGRLYSVGSVVAVPLALSGISKLGSLLESILKFARTSAVGLLVIFLVGNTFFTHGLSPDSRPVQPALSWIRSRTLDSDQRSLNSFLISQGNEPTILYFPSSELIVPRFDPDFSLPYHTTPNLRFSARSIWPSTSNGYQDFQTNFLVPLVTTGSSTDLLNVAKAIGAEFVIFHLPSLTDSEFELVQRVRRNRIPSLMEVKSSSVDKFHGLQNFVIFRNLSQVLPISITSEVPIRSSGYFKKSSTKFMITYQIENQSISSPVVIQLRQGFSSLWKAEANFLADQYPCDIDSNSGAQNPEFLSESCYTRLANSDFSASNLALKHTSSRPSPIATRGGSSFPEGFNYFVVDTPINRAGTIIVSITLPMEDTYRRLFFIQSCIQVLLITYISYKGYYRNKVERRVGA